METIKELVSCLTKKVRELAAELQAVFTVGTVGMKPADRLAKADRLIVAAEMFSSLTSELKNLELVLQRAQTARMTFSRFTNSLQRSA